MIKDKNGDFFDYNAGEHGHSAFGGFLEGMDKERKKAERLHKKQVKIKKQMRIAKSAGVPVKHPNKLAKKHATNCGRPRCQLCGNPRRISGEKTIQERRAEQE